MTWYSTTACGSTGAVHKSQVKGLSTTNNKKAETSNNKELDKEFDEAMKGLMKIPILDLIGTIEAERKKDTDKSAIAVLEYLVAKRFEEGIGTKEDMEKAFIWYEKAANDGDIDSKLRVAIMLLFGKGVSQDTKKGLEIIEELALQGNEKALLLAAKLTEMAKEKEKK